MPALTVEPARATSRAATTRDGARMLQIMSDTMSGENEDVAMAKMDWLFDDRTRCWSVQTLMSVRDYLRLVHDAHENQGAITGQRAVLATTTAKRIRSRMVSDLKMGAVIPPVVIGAVVEDSAFKSLPLTDGESLDDILEASKGDLSIIDGMQRTAALMEAFDADRAVGSRQIRVEFWLTTSVRAMVYRMLVLNTGQVPWTISRQLSVVYSPLLQEVENNVPALSKLISPDKTGRRVAAAQYGSDSIVELYIAFSLRKTTVDTKEQVSDEFSRLDFVDNLGEQDFQDQFYAALELLANLDIAFSSFEAEGQERLTRGRHIFDSQPARIGFIVAVGAAVLGRPGANRHADTRNDRLRELEKAQGALIQKLSGMTNEELGDFLRLDVLREVLDRRVGQVGRYERLIYNEAFKVLIEVDYELENMEPCWRAG